MVKLYQKYTILNSSYNVIGTCDTYMTFDVHHSMLLYMGLLKFADTEPSHLNVFLQCWKQFCRISLYAVTIKLPFFLELN